MQKLTFEDRFANIFTGLWDYNGFHVYRTDDKASLEHSDRSHTYTIRVSIQKSYKMQGIFWGLICLLFLFFHQYNIEKNK